jgi:hypothetical protein
MEIAPRDTSSEPSSRMALSKSRLPVNSNHPPTSSNYRCKPFELQRCSIAAVQAFEPTDTQRVGMQIIE